MSDNHHCQWKIALTATPHQHHGVPLLLCGDLPGAFRHAAEEGCQAVEIHLGRADELDANALKQLIADSGLSVPTLGTGLAASDGLSFASPHRVVRARTVERVNGHTELAAEIGSAVTIGILSGKLGQCNAEEFLRRRSLALDCLDQVCEFARRRGVVILLEPLNRYECDYINTLADGMRVIEEIGAPNLRLLADTFHMNIEEIDLRASLIAAGSHIAHVHLADTNRQVPGHGHMDLAGILDALSTIHYEDYLSLEVLPLPDAETAIRDAIRVLRTSEARVPPQSSRA